jgi:hypothetical protein
VHSDPRFLDSDHGFRPRFSVFGFDEFRKKVGVQREIAMKKLWLLGLFFLIVMANYACAAGKKKPANSGSLSVKVAIVYKMGGPQPVARTKLYLLDVDFDDLVRSQTTEVPVIVLPITALFDAAFKSESARTAGIVESSITSHIKAVATTDFQGSATFKNVPLGQYHLVGMTLTRKEDEFVFWNQVVNVQATNDEMLISQDDGFVSDSIYLQKKHQTSIGDALIRDPLKVDTAGHP